MKLYIHQDVKGVELARALLMFPIDMAFLALSFGVGIFTYLQAQNNKIANTGNIIGILILYLSAIIIIIILSKRSDRAFVDSQNWRVVIFTIMSYFMSLFSMYLCLSYMGAL
jgi:hypothetical protein